MRRFDERFEFGHDDRKRYDQFQYGMRYDDRERHDDRRMYEERGRYDGGRAMVGMMRTTLSLIQGLRSQILKVRCIRMISLIG